MNSNLVYVWLSIGSISFFSFLIAAIAVNANRRQKENFYENETIKKIAKSPDSATWLLEYMREKNQRATKKYLRGGLRLSGLIQVAVSIGLLIFLHSNPHTAPWYLVGLIPLLAGVAKLVYTYWLAPKE